MYSRDFDLPALMFPPSDHPRYEDAVNAYQAFGCTLRLHLLNKEVISADRSPKAEQKMLSMAHNKDGFNVLFEIIKK